MCMSSYSSITTVVAALPAFLSHCQVEIERVLPQFKGDACAGQLDDLLRTCLRLHAEMAHITTNLQYYINLEVVECKQGFWVWGCRDVAKGVAGLTRA